MGTPESIKYIITNGRMINWNMNKLFISPFLPKEASGLKLEMSLVISSVLLVGRFLFRVYSWCGLCRLTLSLS